MPRPESTGDGDASPNVIPCEPSTSCKPDDVKKEQRLKRCAELKAAFEERFERRDRAKKKKIEWNQRQQKREFEEAIDMYQYDSFLGYFEL